MLVGGSELFSQINFHTQSQVYVLFCSGVSLNQFIQELSVRPILAPLYITGLVTPSNYSFVCLFFCLLFYVFVYLYDLKRVIPFVTYTGYLYVLMIYITILYFKTGKYYHVFLK